jgi:HEAT repeat protein
VNERIAGLEGALQANVGQVGQQVESIRTALTSIQQETRVLVATAVDYRPLFDELRSQLQRQATVLADLRAMPVALAGPGEPAEAAGARPPVVEPADGPAVPEALAAHVKKLGDADAAVRFEAVDALISSKNLAVLPRLLPMARDSDSFVRRLTIEGLLDFKHPDAVEELLVALGDSDVSVAETAWNSLKKLTGQKIPFDAAAPSKDARQRAQQRWQEWWEKNKATFGS